MGNGQEFELDHRLVNIGESVIFTLREAEAGDSLSVYPRYLENAGGARRGGDGDPLPWLGALERVVLPAEPAVRYTPPVAGNYLARWTSRRYGTEYRYFAVIDQSYVIYRPAIWGWPTPFPADAGVETRSTGLPFDWSVGTGNATEPWVARLREEQQRFGGGIVCEMSAGADAGPGSAEVDALRRTVAGLRARGLDVGRVANLWQGDRLSNAKVRAARAAGFDVIDGYVPRASSCGMGAPYFPFYISATDYRFPSQAGPTDAVACVFDFVGSWHFHGPVGFHRPSANGNWARAKQAIDLAAAEAVLAARNSRTHNFLTTLINYESPIAWGTPSYQVVWDEERGREFFRNYIELLAFEHPRRWPIVFARAADYADYFRAHYAEMPRRIISSITHDIDYDRWWTDEWHERGLRPAGQVPPDQSLRAFRKDRAMPQYNMPVAHEFVNYNDNRRTCRFEYACPKPVHYYDLAGSAPWPAQPVETDLPDPQITWTTRTGEGVYEISCDLTGDGSFSDYLLAIWEIPAELRDCPVETNAKEFIWVENTDGHGRGIVRFDLEPACRLTLRWHLPAGRDGPAPTPIPSDTR